MKYPHSTIALSKEAFGEHVDESKEVTGCLMNSRRIHHVLDELAASRNINNDSHMAVVAALKLMEPTYQGVGTEDIADDLKVKSRQDLFTLARLIHPVLCSLKLEKWPGLSGQCHYLVQFAAPRGGAVRQILLDGSAHEIGPGGIDLDIPKQAKVIYGF